MINENRKMKTKLHHQPSQGNETQPNQTLSTHTDNGAVVAALATSTSKLCQQVCVVDDFLLSSVCSFWYFGYYCFVFFFLF